MSEIKVNKISPRTACGTVTVGDSGDSVCVSAGVAVTVQGDLKSPALKATDGGVIISQSGTDITVGASGDTIALASGASQTGFGRTGTVDWDTASIKATGFTAVSGNGYFCNTTGGAFTATFPASPTAGDIVGLADYTRTFETNNLTIGRNSKPIGGISVDGTLSVNGQSATFVFVDDTEGWININETQTSQTGVPPYIIATGGTPCAGAIVCTNYKQHTFTGPGTFTVANVAACSADNAVAYLIVAGGGSGGDGGGGEGGGGGGAGGFREGTTAPIVPYSASPLVNATGVTVTATAYPITIGAGGSPGLAGGNPVPAPVGSNGNPATALGLTSAGGGFSTGGGSDASLSGTGGSGGGGNGRCGPAVPGNSTGQAGNTPPVSPAQGFPGGNGLPSPGNRGGGGGGATVIGGNAACNPNSGGIGGAGATTSINATPTAYAGGGGGGNQGGPSPVGGVGGTGGGGDGRKNAAGVNGTDNTGGGGGGNSCGQNWPSVGAGGIGGSGIVILRYKFQ